MGSKQNVMNGWMDGWMDGFETKKLKQNEMSSSNQKKKGKDDGERRRLTVPSPGKRRQQSIPACGDKRNVPLGMNNKLQGFFHESPCICIDNQEFCFLKKDEMNDVCVYVHSTNEAMPLMMLL